MIGVKICIETKKPPTGDEAAEVFEFI